MRDGDKRTAADLVLCGSQSSQRHQRIWHSFAWYWGCWCPRHKSAAAFKLQHRLVKLDQLWKPPVVCLCVNIQRVALPLPLWRIHHIPCGNEVYSKVCWQVRHLHELGIVDQLLRSRPLLLWACNWRLRSSLEVVEAAACEGSCGQGCSCGSTQPAEPTRVLPQQV